MSNNSNNNWGNVVGLMIAFVILGSIIKIFLPKDMDKELKNAWATVIGVVVVVLLCWMGSIAQEAGY